MRIASRRRLTLAPGWLSATTAGTGSRFSCLETVEAVDASKVDEGSAIDDSSELSSSVRRRKTDEELADEFWADIGYPTPASMVWERPSSLRAGEVFQVCKSEAHGDSNSREDAANSNSVGPEVSPRMPAAEMRGVVDVPARSTALVKPWIGPLLPPRVSVARKLGDLLAHGCLDEEEASPTSSSPAVIAGPPGRGASSSTIWDCSAT
ncbi:hypothetical protein D1007_56617 [Hordeum vulgare]|nr:hypothetical protein D1007_56617 [Hordeum vulgare]